MSPLRLPAHKAHKYRAVRTEVDGIAFASKKEAARYVQLRALEKAGEIRNLRLQPGFELHAMRQLNTHGEAEYARERIGGYRGDFAYETRYFVTFEGRRKELWREVVEDAKGFRTPLYKWKKRHVEAQYGIQIREI